MPTSFKEHLETILVVDDTDSLLKVIVKILERANFRVLSASTGPSALQLASITEGDIHLLLSDVEMGEMSGPDLGEMLKKTRPYMHVMLMSGATNGNLPVFNYGWAYIQKPFAPKKLVEMVNEVLHTKDQSQLGRPEFDSSKKDQLSEK